MIESHPAQRSIQELEKMPLIEMADRWALDEKDPELLGQRIEEKHNLLIACYKDGTLKAYEGADGRHWVTLIDLQEWARNNGDSPRFLFPEYNPNRHLDIIPEYNPKQDLDIIPDQVVIEKNVKNNSEFTFSDPEINSMLKMLLGMAIDAYGYDPKADRNTATGENRGSIKAYLQTIGLNIDKKTVAKFLKIASLKNPDITRKP